MAVKSGWNLSLSSFSADIKKAFEGDIEKIGFYTFSRLQDVSPVGNPSLWENPMSAPKGYVGGQFRRSWTITKNNSSYTLNNPMPYAEPLDDGHSSQAPFGILDVVLADLTVFA